MMVKVKLEAQKILKFRYDNSTNLPMDVVLLLIEKSNLPKRA